MTDQTTLLPMAVIDKTTLLHALELAKKPLSRIDIQQLIQAPDRFPTARLISYCKTSKFIDSKYEIGSKEKHYFITENGKKYLKNNSELIQEFGVYDLTVTGRAKPAKQASLPLTQEATFSPAVQEAMRELEAVATMNEQARNCLAQLEKTISSFNLITIDTDLELHGSLNLVQDDTRECVNLIADLETKIAALAAEAE